MRRLAAALALAACQAQAQPAPACADGQQNLCKCEGREGVQVCSAGKYSECECSAASRNPETRIDDPLTAAQLEDARTNAVLLQQLVEQFQIQKRRCPSDVIEMVEVGFATRTPKDPWGSVFELRCENGGNAEVISLGPDRTLGTGDDISSQS